MGNPFDEISRAGDKISGAISVVSSKKEYILKQGINAVLLFIILAVFGCLDFATLTFHIEYLLTASYWGIVSSKLVAGLCAFNIGINLMWDTEIMKDRLLAESIVEYEKLIKYKQLDFEWFVVHIFNKREKIKAYKNKINKRIYLLNRFSRAKDRLLYSSEIAEQQPLKEKNWYCVHRKRYEELKTDEYIEKNIDSLKVRYDEVDASVFELEIDGTTKTSGLKTKGNATLGRVKASSGVAFSMLGFSMFITAFGLQLNAEQFASQMEAFWHYFLKCAEDVGVILWQVSKGLLRTRKIISSELTQPYCNRIKVLKEYLEWRLTNNKEDSKVYSLFKDKDNEQVIELTQEQLEKFLPHSK